MLCERDPPIVGRPHILIKATGSERCSCNSDKPARKAAHAWGHENRKHSFRAERFVQNALAVSLR